MSGSSERPVDIKSLADQLDQLQDQNAKETVLIDYLKRMKDNEDLSKRTTVTQIGGEVVYPEGAKQDRKAAQNELELLIIKHQLEKAHSEWVFSETLKSNDQPLDRLPCANVKPGEDWRCMKDGTMACANCRLVSYCSKDCQRAHWTTHKRDCKDPIRSTNWQPAWVQERREPSFSSSAPGWTISEHDRKFALGLNIWGTIPAIDILNISMNEGESAMDRDFVLGHVASGDLRHVVRTINELPHDYSGHLTIVLNDREPIIVLRNVLLLIVLGGATDEDMAQVVDAAVHFWASAFIQECHQVLHLHALTRVSLELIQSSNIIKSIRLGERSTLSIAATQGLNSRIMDYLAFHMDIDQASTELHRVRFESTREDRHHRDYLRLSPSHRLSFLEYLRFGIVLPFGAADNRFNTANKFLFSPTGRWLENDLASPLHSWKIEDVVASGKKHGAQPEDIYGCLYFYLSDQLRSFAERLKRFHISFRMFNEDAQELARNFKSSGSYLDLGMEKGVRFDRVEVANIIDKEYVGIPKILADWTPLLSKTNACATIVGYSMNWPPKQYGSEPKSGPVMTTLLLKLVQMKKIPENFNPNYLASYMKYLMAIYDNSAAFETYLQREDTEDAARRVGAKRKKKHTIVPHRIGAPIDGPKEGLPLFDSEESWYFNVQVHSSLLSEKFIEFSRAVSQ